MTVSETQMFKPARLSGEVVDALAEMVAGPNSPTERALAVDWVLGQIIEAITWRHAFELQPPEAESLSRLQWAAVEHVQRMSHLVSSDR